MQTQNQNKATYRNKLGQNIPVIVLGWAGEDWPRNVIRVKIAETGEEFNVWKNQLFGDGRHR